MRLTDRIRRWWKPAKWRDEHPEESDGEDSNLAEDQRLGSHAPGLFERYGDEHSKGM
jgi:hypothetical protein